VSGFTIAVPIPPSIALYSGDAATWDAAVDGFAGATAAHLYAWKPLIEDVYQQECPYIAARRAGRITAVLPLVDVRSVLFGRSLVSMPYLNSGGPIGDNTDIRALSEYAVELARSLRIGELEFRALRSLPIGLRSHSEKVGTVLDLPASIEELWKALGSKLRSQIRRPQKEGVEMRFGPDQVAPFFRVFSRNMRDLGSPTHAARFFSAIAEKFGDRAWFGCAWLRNQPIAAGCGLQFGDEVEMTWASTIREFNSIAPNMLLYWTFMERAIQQGLRRFNFGRSTPGSGPHRFKLQWGGRDVPLHWYRWPDKAGGAPRQDSGPMAIATRVWQKLPVPLATAIGARLRGGISA